MHSTRFLKWVMVFCMTTLALSEASAVSSSLPGHLQSEACTRSCLEGFIDRYLDALVTKQPRKLPWSATARFTENNVVLEIGDGLWGTASGIGRPEQGVKFADAARGQAAWIGVVEERGDLVYLFLRLRVVGGQITEAETIVNRKEETGARGDPARLEHDPLLVATIAPEARTPAARMVDLANGYFSTLQLNDGKLFTEFDERCIRRENGKMMAGVPDSPDALIKLSCADQFKLGFFRFDDRVRERAFPLVDEERGIVLARGFIDHAGRLGKYTLTNGTVRESRVKAPHSWHFLEVFRIEQGRIRSIESVFIFVPYGSPSPWTE